MRQALVLVGTGVLLGGPVSGGAGNPARAFGPMIVSGTFPVWFYYCAGPLLGALIAAAAHRLVGPASTPKRGGGLSFPFNEKDGGHD